MEGKLIPYKTKMLAIIFILAIGETMGGIIFPDCFGPGEDCGFSRHVLGSCCTGSFCANTHTGVFGGTCMLEARSPFTGKRGCQEEGDVCGALKGNCCDKLECSNPFTSGTCEDKSPKAEPTTTCLIAGEECEFGGIKLPCCEGFLCEGVEDTSSAFIEYLAIKKCVKDPTYVAEPVNTCEKEGDWCGNYRGLCCKGLKCSGTVAGICFA